MTLNTEKSGVRVEIAEKTLIRLLSAGQICVADMRCLDCESKKCLWRLCLKSCAKCLSSGTRPPSGANLFCCACGRHFYEECQQHCQPNVCHHETESETSG